ncbi:nuclear transport factor 2 family protein [Streptomyces capparidis]
MSTRAVVEEFLVRLGEGDAEHTAELFADEVDCMVAGSPEVPWLRPRRTRADMADLFATMAAHFVPEKRSVTPMAFLVDGENAVLTGHAEQTLRASGRVLSFPFALLLSVRDGRITRYHVFEDSLAVAEAVRDDRRAREEFPQSPAE